ncbi:MAG: A/G-specific adenine glycosylase [Alkalispirochaeta sp.]
MPVERERFPLPPVSGEERLRGDSEKDRGRFRSTILDYYAWAGRTMPWRDQPTPYWVFVSEMMLQQTQVKRVLVKFLPFVARFPSFPALAEAAFSEILSKWSGLGYNRRARFMHRAAQEVVTGHNGQLPSEPQQLQALPGIGPNTAGSIAAFAYNRPVVFIETNIRRVFLHFFFPREEQVHDRQLFPLIETTLFREDPRRWYWALMDYGVALARVTENPNRRSRHYMRQKPFVGSDRQLRGRILKALTESGSLSAAELPMVTGADRARSEAVAAKLETEGLLARDAPDRWTIAD